METHIRRAYVIYILSRSVDKTVLHRDRPAIIVHVKAAGPDEPGQAGGGAFVDRRRRLTRLALANLQTSTPSAPPTGGALGLLSNQVAVGNFTGSSPPHRTPSPHHQGQCHADVGYAGCAGGGQKTDERCDVQPLRSALLTCDKHAGNTTPLKVNMTLSRRPPAHINGSLDNESQLQRPQMRTDMRPRYLLDE